MMNEELLLQWNRRGVLLLPQESEDAYAIRCTMQAALEQQLRDDVLNKNHSFLSQHINRARSKLKKLYDIDPNWVPIIVSNQGISFWEAACTWIEENDTGYVQTWIQVKPGFLEPKARLGIVQKLYDLREILSHEMVHAARCRLHASRYEECFAYITTQKKGILGYLSRWCGPIFLNGKEPLIWCLLLLIPTFLLSLAITIDHLIWIGEWSTYLPIPFCLYSIFLLTRLSKTWMTWNQCRKNLYSMLGKEKRDLVLPIMIRLSDQEILYFSKANNFDEIRAYIKQSSEKELRWKVIQKAYLQ